jgi:hypothetical protein
MYKKYLSFLLVLPLFFVFAQSAFAITFNPNPFPEGETSVTVTCENLSLFPDSEYAVFDATDTLVGGNVCEQFDTYDFIPYQEFIVIEFKNGSYNCNSVATCQSDLQYIDTESVNVNPPPTPTPTPSSSDNPVAIVVNDTGTTLKDNLVSGLSTGAPFLVGTSVLFWAYSFIVNKIKGSAR